MPSIIKKAKNADISVFLTIVNIEPLTCKFSQTASQTIKMRGQSFIGDIIWVRGFEPPFDSDSHPWFNARIAKEKLGFDPYHFFSFFFFFIYFFFFFIYFYLFIYFLFIYFFYFLFFISNRRRPCPYNIIYGKTRNSNIFSTFFNPKGAAGL